MIDSSEARLDLRKYLSQESNRDLYTISNGGVHALFEEDVGEWLVWDPSESVPSDDPMLKLGESLKANNFLWSAFQTEPGSHDAFVPGVIFSGVDDVEDRESVANKLAADFETLTDSVPLSAVRNLKAVQDEARNELGIYGAKLEKNVMEPLRDVYIACAVEARRKIADPRSTSDLNSDQETAWNRTLAELNAHYLEVGKGFHFENLVTPDEWSSSKLSGVPFPVANGARAALSAYIKPGDARTPLLSRDAILERARPVYYRWDVAQRAIQSALHGDPFEVKIPDIFTERSTLTEHASSIVKKYKDEPSSLPDAMTRFMEWVPDSENAEGRGKVIQLQRAIREAGLEDRYEDGDPESFCELLEELLRSHQRGLARKMF